MQAENKAVELSLKSSLVVVIACVAGFQALAALGIILYIKRRKEAGVNG